MRKAEFRKLVMEFGAEVKKLEELFDEINSFEFDEDDEEEMRENGRYIDPSILDVSFVYYMGEKLKKPKVQVAGIFEYLDMNGEISERDSDMYRWEETVNLDGIKFFEISNEKRCVE